MKLRNIFLLLAVLGGAISLWGRSPNRAAYRKTLERTAEALEKTAEAFASLVRGLEKAPMGIEEKQQMAVPSALLKEFKSGVYQPMFDALVLLKGEDASFEDLTEKFGKVYEALQQYKGILEEAGTHDFNKAVAQMGKVPSTLKEMSAELPGLLKQRNLGEAQKDKMPLALPSMTSPVKPAPGVPNAPGKVEPLMPPMAVPSTAMTLPKITPPAPPAPASLAPPAPSPGPAMPPLPARPTPSLPPLPALSKPETSTRPAPLPLPPLPSAPKLPEITTGPKPGAPAVPPLPPPPVLPK